MMMIHQRGLGRLCEAAAAGPHLQCRLNATRCLSAGTSSTSPSPASADAARGIPSPATGSSIHQDANTDTSYSNEAPEAPDSTSPPQEAPHFSNKNPFWTAFKAIVAGSLAAGTFTSAYVSYAYTSEQIEKKTSALQAQAEVKNLEEDSLLQKVQNVLYSNTLKAAVGVAELYLQMRKAIEDQVKGFAAPTSEKLLPDLLPQERHVFTLVIDLNETLVYSDWTRDRGWRTFKRPGAEAFLEHLAQFYELVIYTDQLPFTVDPILEKLDQKGCIRYRLAREATQYIHGKHYKDLSKLNRDPAHVMFLSAHAKETCLQPENAVLVKPWKLEPDDTELLDMLPFLEYVARYRPADVRSVLASYDGQDIPSEFLVRTKDYQKKMRELKSQNPFFRSAR